MLFKSGEKVAEMKGADADSLAKMCTEGIL
jgi:hypothetical protein